MSKIANGTDAKDVALHFVQQTNVERITPAIMSKTINQAKNLLNSGYTKQEIVSVIDYVLTKGTHMHSIGYVSTCINDVLREIEKQRLLDEAVKVKKEINARATEKQSEVNVDVESAERNRLKANRFGVQSGFGEKYSFDMFEGK